MGEWVTIRKAATRLGVSADTVRRKVKRGELSGRQERATHGPTWLVELPTNTPQDAPGSPTAPETNAEALTALRAHIATLETQLTTKDRQIGELHILLERMQRALPSPPDEERHAGGQSLGHAEGAGEGMRRVPWWRRWRRTA